MVSKELFCQVISMIYEQEETDLQLNNSNINAWLKSGNETKAALGTARRILDYLEKSAVKIG